MTDANAIAIVAIGCRYPGGVRDPESLWKLLQNKVDAVRPIPSDRWDVRKYYDPRPQIPGKMYTREGAFLSDDVWGFDNEYFGISPIEAERLDPQQRLLLKVTVEALESAHITKRQMRGSRTGVYIGAFTFDNFVDMYSTEEKIRRITAQTHSCGVVTMLSARLSYYFGLHGTCLSVDTACSSSLVAFHLACQAMRDGEIDQALVGGVNVMFRPEFTVTMCYGGFLAKDGRCKTFDASADGYGRGEGAGVLVLKRYAQAVEDGNEIYAIVAGTGCNQDGRTNGITVPNEAAQLDLMRSVARRAGVLPAQIGYAEAHGTGTLVGDPKEAESLGRFLLTGRDPELPYHVGSVKTNIGHQEAGAGVAALIKTALCLKHGQIVPNLHFKNPNPNIDFEGLRLRVPTEVTSLEADYSCINSFGFGGTNAHVILRKASIRRASARVTSPGLERPALFTLSASTDKALELRAKQLAESLAEHSLQDVSHTVCCHRDHERMRAALVVRSKADAILQLQALGAGERAPAVVRGRVREDNPKPLVFLYTGMGPQVWGMGSELMRQEPAFSAAIHRMDETFCELSSWSLSRLFSDPESFGAKVGQSMDEPEYAQPANLALQLALTEVWAARGLRPDCVVGHSVGEIAAACVAGSLSLEDALRLAYHRGRLHQGLSGRGGMLAVGLSVDEAAEFLHGSAVSIAAVNSPHQLTLAGANAELDSLANLLEARGKFCKRLRVKVPYHSSLMEETRENFFANLVGIRPAAPKLRLCSTTTGQWVTSAEQDCEYWWRNARDSVSFLQAMREVVRSGYRDFLEVGPHPVLRGSVLELLQGERMDDGFCVESMQRGEGELARLEKTLALLYVRGVEPDWSVLTAGGHRVTLPSYPWDERRFAFFQDSAQNERLVKGTHPLLQEARKAPGSSWHTEVNPQYFPWLADHQMQNQAILPGAVYVEAVLACSAAFGKGGPHSYAARDISLASIQSVERNVELDVTLTDDRVEIHGREVLADEWERRASGRFVRGKLGPTTPRLDFRAEITPGMRVYEREQIYSCVAGFGYHFGPKFQVVRRFHVRENVIYGLIDASHLADEIDQYVIHPVLLDGVFQVLNGVYVAGMPASRNGQYLPAGVDEVRLFRRGLSQCWVRCAIPDDVGRTVSMDISIFDLDGEVVGEVRGYHSKIVSSGERGAVQGRDCLYAVDWEPAAWPVDDEGAGTAEAARTGVGRWLVFADRGGVAESLCKGHPHTVVRRELWDKPELLRSELAHLFAKESFEGAVYGWALDSMGPKLPVSCATGTDDCICLLELAQGALRVHSPTWQKLVVLTAANLAQPGGAVNPGHAALIGFCRTLNLEHPWLHATVVDSVDRVTELGRRRWLLSAALGVAELTCRADGYLTPRLTALRNVPVARVSSGSVENYELRSAKPGSLSSLEFVQLPRPELGPTDVEIEVKASALNFKDLMKALGLLDASYTANTHFGDGLGMECAGVVSRVGSAVTRYRVGDAVISATLRSFARFVVAPEKAVFSKPRPLTFAESVIAFINATPVHYGLVKKANLQRGERILIHSASGGVGLVAVQLAQLVGAEVFATAGSEQKREYLRSLGVRHVSDSRSLRFYDDVMTWTQGEGVDVVLNFLSGELMEKSLELLTFGGRFIELGKADIFSNTQLGLGRFSKSITYTHVDLDHMSLHRPEQCLSLLGEVLDLYESGKLRAIRTTTYPAAQAIEAFDRMRSEEHIGKIVLDMADTTGLEVVPRPAPLPVRKGGTYLIVGGYSELGLLGAKWLIQAGAERIGLIGRSGARTDEVRAQLTEWRAQGITIDELRGDVSSESEVQRLLQEQQWPVYGVLHLATAYCDAPVIEQSPDSIREVMKAKAWGAHFLVRGLPKETLDWFVSFSSVSAFGNYAQANYSAANAYLDALAHCNSAAGTRMLSINWGVVNAGEAKRNVRLASHFKSIGVTSLEVDSIYPLLQEAAQSTFPQLAALDLNWSKFLKHSGLAQSGLFQRQVQAHSSSARSNAAGQLATLSSEEQQRFAELLVARHVSDVLRIPSERVDPDTRMDELGVDSLMAVTLSHVIAQDSGVELGSVRFLQKPSVRKLAADWLVLKLQGQSARAEGENGGAAEDLVWLQSPAQPKGRLVCVPGARMSAAGFAAWIPDFPDLELVAANYAGGVDRASEEPTSLSEIAESLAAALIALPQVGSPLILFGHSFGGLLVYELACTLRSAGVSVAGVIVAAASTPDAKHTFTRAEIDRATTSVVSDAVATQEAHVTNIRRLLGGYAVAPEQRKPLETRFALLLAEHDEFFNSDKLEGWRGFAREVQVQRFNTGHNMLADGGVMSAIKVLCEQWGRPL